MIQLRRMLIFLFAMAAVSAATTIVPMSVEELAHAASDIVEGHAGRSWSAWNPQHNLIYTYTEFQITRTLKGSAPQTVIVKQLGGTAEGYTQKVSGVRQFQQGEEALLFLRPSVTADRTMVVVGLMQGNFRVARSGSGEAMASNGVSGAESFDRGRVKTFTGDTMRLGDIEARVTRSLQ